MEYFNLLPEEITLDIISRLPTEDVLECKLVCSNWRSLVRDPSFSKMHLDHLHHPAADSEIDKVGKHREISGFGYVASTNVYKVVRMMFEDETEFMEAHIYTLGSRNGWRNIGKFDLGADGCYQEGIFVNGVLYWLDYDSEMMVTFDLAEEEFCEHLALPSPPEYDYHDYYLGVLDGCLSFAIKVISDGATCWDVWLLRNKDDNQGVKQQEVHHSLGWVKVFTTVDGYGLFAVTKSYAALTYYSNHINIHHLDASTSKMIVDFRERFSSVIPHKNTFVSLKELGEEDTKIM
ncbi:putative F-box protein At3g16820 [Papaver somniferum]|uniref:putative F-box protein At3g16820 n=1 Tax=Papaver somniferum TaxID=3469 RepID=UPI000E6FFB76|nr:putative F-box protein At3g16820 [Papaver somniferum]